MRWSKDSNILLSASDEGVIKIWSSSLRPLCDPVLVHEEAVREVSLGPGDTPSKFVSCSDDKTAIIWDLDHFTYECILKGHGWNVNSCDWHPYMALIATGSRDSKIKLWDPREGRETYTIHNHKQQVSKVRWSLDGNMILSGSKDTSCKLHDVRTMNEFQTFKSHEKDVSCIAWHPTHPNIFVSGGQDGSMAYWAVGQNMPISFDPNAHDLVIHDLLWHPMGHILASGSEDQVVKIWYSDITA